MEPLKFDKPEDPVTLQPDDLFAIYKALHFTVNQNMFDETNEVLDAQEEALKVCERVLSRSRDGAATGTT